MTYPLEKKFSELPPKGMKRLAMALKLALVEAPRLQMGFFSNDKKTREVARLEIVWLIGHLDQMAQQVAHELGIPLDEVWEQVEKAADFSADEMGMLKALNQSLLENRGALFKKKPPKSGPGPTSIKA